MNRWTVGPHLGAYRERGASLPLKVRSWDAETLVELGCSDSFPATGDCFHHLKARHRYSGVVHAHHSATFAEGFGAEVLGFDDELALVIDIAPFATLLN